MAYWDTSCLLKLYAPEADSAVFEAYIRGGTTVVTAELARLELFAALRRKESGNDLRPGGARTAMTAYDADRRAGLILDQALNPATVAEFETIIERCHTLSPMVPLRTLDAIHLATASVAQESEIVAADKRLREAAIRLGFSVYPPP